MVSCIFSNISFRNGKRIAEIEEMMKKYFGNSVPSHSMIYKGFMEFRFGHTSSMDVERFGRLFKIPPEEMINKIHVIV